jgi:hypothetical protein
MPVNSEADDKTELRLKLAHARERVIRASLSLAKHHFAEPAEDPGWEADLNEDQLDEAIQEYSESKTALAVTRMADRPGEARWDETRDSSITPEQAHEVAANWRDTTQLSNALDACADRLSDYERVLRLAEEALDKHDEWCGYKADSPGNAIYSRALVAIRAVLSGKDD